MSSSKKLSGGESFLSKVLSPRKSACKRIEVPDEAVGVDRTKLESLRGPLKKQSRKGRWQKRYFRTVNHYLVYFASSKMIEIRSCHDLVDVISVAIIGRFGHIEIVMKSDENGEDDWTISLQAKDLDEAQQWVDNLNARRKLFEGHVIDEKGSKKKRRPSGWALLRKTAMKDFHHVDVEIEGPVMQLTRSRFKPWKSRFLRLVSGELRFYKSEPLTTEGFKKYVAVVNCLTVSSVSFSDEFEDTEEMSPAGEKKLQTVFVLHTTSNTKDIVIRACATGTGIAYVSAQLMCRRWVAAANAAHEQATKAALGHLDSHLEKKEKSDQHASNPYIVQQYDVISDAGARAKMYAAQFRQSFSDVDAAEDSIEVVVAKLNEVLQELSDVAEICSGIVPSRHEIFRDYVDVYHPLIEQKVIQCVYQYPDDDGGGGGGGGNGGGGSGGAENDQGETKKGEAAIEAHETLRILDFLKGYSELLESHLEGHHGLFDFGNAGGTRSLVEMLSELYVNMAKHDFMQMCLRISNFIMTHPNDAVHGVDTGILSSTGPVDLLNMIHEYIGQSAKSGLDSLQAKVFVMCSQGVTAYLHDLELRVAQIRHLLMIDFEDVNVGEHKDVKEKGNPNTLLFLCVLVNDAELLVETFDALEDEYSDLIEDHEYLFSGMTLEEHVSNTIHECQSLGQLALLQIQRVIFDDLNPMIPELMTSKFSVLETMLATMQDYFQDFEVHIRPVPFMKMLGYCYECTLKIYMAYFIEAHTDNAKRVKKGQLGGLRVALDQEQADEKFPDAHATLRKNLHRIQAFFVQHAADVPVFRGAKRSFRIQLILSDFIEDVVYRLPISKVHEAFVNLIKQFAAAQAQCFPHIMVLFSRLTLLRNYAQEALQWSKDLESLTGGASIKSPKHFPHSRKNILKKCFAVLAEDPFSVDVEAMRGALVNAEAKLQSYLTRLPKRNEIRKMHKQGQIILRGDAAEASLDIVRFVKAQNIVTGIGLPGDKIELQLCADAVLAGALDARKAGGARRNSVLGSLFHRARAPSSEKNERRGSIASLSKMVGTGSFMFMFRSSRATQNTSQEAALARARAAANPLSFFAEAPVAPGGVGTVQAMSPEQEKALEQGVILLQMGAIRQNEYDELERSIMSAHARLAEEGRLPVGGGKGGGGGGMIDENQERSWLHAAIKTRLSAFDDLDEGMQRAIVYAFDKVYAPGTVMEQGAEGDCMFIVKSGNYDVFVDGKLVNTLGVGALFGELAMLFSAPRNASIVYRKDESTNQAGMLWKISRLSFHAAINETNDKLEDDSSIVGRLSEQFRTDSRFRRKRSRSSFGKDSTVTPDEVMGESPNPESRRILFHKTSMRTFAPIVVPQKSHGEGNEKTGQRPNIMAMKSLQRCESLLEALDSSTEANSRDFILRDDDQVVPWDGDQVVPLEAIREETPVSPKAGGTTDGAKHALVHYRERLG